MGTTKIPKKEPVFKVKVKFDKGKKKKFNFKTHMPGKFKKGTRVNFDGRLGTVVKIKKTREMSRL